MLDSLMQFHDCGTKFELPSKLVRYIEYESVVLFLLDENGKRDKIIGVKFSQKGGINHFYIDWEFQIIDGLGEIHEIVEMVKKLFEEKEVIYCRGWGFDIGYYLDPNTGAVLYQEPTR